MLKTNSRHFLIISILTMLLFICACTKLCNSGYEGSRCNVLTTTKFEGSWAAVDTPHPLIYTDTISSGGTLGDITLSTAFAGHRFNHVVNASVLNNIITIPYQQPDSANNFVQGTGTLSNDNRTISFTYQLISGPDSQQTILNYTGNWSKAN